MTPDPTERNGLDHAEEKFLAGIEEFDWVVTRVFPRSKECNYFAYSTGMFLKFKQPEIVMFGLPLERMHRVINIIGNQMKQGLTFVPGQDYTEILDSYPCQFRVVDKSQYVEHLGWSSWFYEGHDYPTLQCFWPDRNGKFPWHPECDVGVRNVQPFLFLPSSSE